MRAWYLTGFFLLGCAVGRSSYVPGQSVAAEAIGSSIAATAASGISRASGGCWASCPTGTFCNPRNGLCDELPCRGLCGADQHCEVTPTGSECLSGRAPPIEITIGRKAGEEPPATPDTSTPPAAKQSPPKSP